MEENRTFDGDGGLDVGVTQSWAEVVFPLHKRLTAEYCLGLVGAFIEIVDEHADRFALALEPFWSDDEFFEQ